MRILFWDIDGTLLSTGRAGIFAWERAVVEVFGGTVDFSSVKTAGLTDTEIAAALSKVASASPTSEDVARVLQRYEHHLPDCLPLRTGTVLPGVMEVLEHLRGVDHVQSMLLTGNTRAGAAAKLAHYGLGQSRSPWGVTVDADRVRSHLYLVTVHGPDPALSHAP